MDRIYYNVDEDFPFDDLSLKDPRSMQGGGYFSKLKVNEDEPLLFQTPKCSTKKGVLKTGKKTYCDLLFSEDNGKFVKWFQKLEQRLHSLIYEKGEEWFDNSLTLDDIDYLFNSSLRVYKGNKYLIRCFVKQPKYIKNDNNLRIYDENENELTLDDITKDIDIINIVEVLGIKYTNGGSSFHLELCLRQIMTFSNKNIFDKCLIQKNMSREQAVGISNAAKEDGTNDEPQTVDVESVEIDEVENSPREITVEADEVDPNNGEHMEDDKLDVSEDPPPKLVIDDNDSKSETLVNLEEVNIDIPEKDGEIKLKKASDVYYKLWREARDKAKIAKQHAIQAFLEAKKIKNTYLLDVDSSDDDIDF